MKISTDATLFKPVTIILETEEELNMLRKILDAGLNAAEIYTKIWYQADDLRQELDRL